MISASERHRNYLKRKFRMRSFVIVHRPFSDEERLLLERYGHWLMALERGKIIPITEAQEHFFRVCKGEVPARTQLERLWIRYANAVEDDIKEVDGRELAEQETLCDEDEKYESVTVAVCWECCGTGYQKDWSDSASHGECLGCCGSGFRAS